MINVYKVVFKRSNDLHDATYATAYVESVSLLKVADSIKFNRGFSEVEVIRIEKLGTLLSA